MSFETAISLSIISSFLAGWYAVLAATVHPLKIFRASFFFAFLVFIVVLILAYAIINNFWIWVLGLGLLMFLSGYLLKSKLFLSTRENVILPEIIQENIKTKEHTSIIYFTHGEPETYNPVAWIKQFREFDEQKIRFVPFIARTFFINALRNKYLIAGKSNHRSEHFRMKKEVEKLIRTKEGKSTPFYMAFLDDQPGVKEAVINAMNDGAKQIVFANVFLTVSCHTACGYDLVKSMECEEKYGVKVLVTEPLWNSETLKQAFIEKVNKKRGNTEKSKIAVILIGYGQPEEWDKIFPTQTEQEIIFREKIIDMFVDDGYKRENMGMAWMDFKKPGISDLLKSFNYKNIEKIFYFAASISADALISQVIIPQKMSKYPFPEHISIFNMGAWNAHPLVIQAIKEKIDKVLIENNSN